MRKSLDTIDASELLERLTAEEETVILDVRSRWEFRRGHLPGARRTPLWRAFLASTAASLDHAPAIVAYCELGPRAWLAGKLLERRGLQVRLLRGHMSRWRRHHLPMR